MLLIEGTHAHDDDILNKKEKGWLPVLDSFFISSSFVRQLDQANGCQITDLQLLTIVAHFKISKISWRIEQ